MESSAGFSGRVLESVGGGEAEVSRAPARLRDLAGQFRAHCVNEGEALGLAWAFTVKENPPELLREAGRFTTGPPATAVRAWAG